MVHGFGTAYAQLPAASTTSSPCVPRADPTRHVHATGRADSAGCGSEGSSGGRVPRGCPLLVVSWQCCMRHLLPWAVVDRMKAAAEAGSTQAAFFTGGCGTGTQQG